jgi:cyanophycinase
MEVIGRGSVTIIDGASAETDAWEVKGHRPVMISGVILHALPSGYKFDLRHRKRIAMPELKALPGGNVAST